MATILLTGFEPFGPDAVNPSWEAVSRLPAEIGTARIVRRRLPVEYDRAARMLEETIRAERPDAVLCVGQAAGRTGLTPERVAINVCDASIPDNAGFRPVDEPEFYRQYRLLTLVRLLQETGAYGFRGLVERKQLFLDCIPTVLGCFRELAAEPFPRYPYLTELLQRLATEWDGRTILPGMESCVAPLTILKAHLQVMASRSFLAGHLCM